MVNPSPIGNYYKAKQGFTLIELMVVVTVIGVLAAAAVPIYRFAANRAYGSEGKATVGTMRKSELDIELYLNLITGSWYEYWP